ncbi:MAG TPA: tetratricopeptide repeat protein [Planctomycetaceae bacterium]|nr:tetratricopeptide repeat protein [Planctomycetaceae bacterium]
MFPFFGLHQLMNWEGSGFLSLLVTGLTIWMLIECLRSDPERHIWWWIILFVPGIGPLIYFFVRWLPTHHVPMPKWMAGLRRGAEIRRLESSARQIGNAYHYVHLGDALRETGHLDRANDAYARALEKEPANLAALWGAALIDMHFRDFETARERLDKILQVDPQYKFGDVSLMYAKSLLELDRNDEATAHLQKHVRRWRHPEGLYLLAWLDSQNGRIQEARDSLQAMLMEIESSPLPIARKQGPWRRRGRHLLRKLG